MLFEFSQILSMQIDSRNRTARVEPGYTLADFDHEAQAYGLATPVGINSTTGIADLTPGGGFGWLSRKYGLRVITCFQRTLSLLKVSYHMRAKRRILSYSGLYGVVAASSAWSLPVSSGFTRLGPRF
jgi:hypothetical protein